MDFLYTSSFLHLIFLSDNAITCDSWQFKTAVLYNMYKLILIQYNINGRILNLPRLRSKSQATQQVVPALSLTTSMHAGCKCITRRTAHYYWQFWLCFSQKISMKKTEIAFHLSPVENVLSRYAVMMIHLNL